MSTKTTATQTTVFIVDDEPSIRKSLGRLLTCAGYAVETFASAEEFLATVGQRECLGCIVLDFSMPGLTGLQLQQELKTRLLPLPVIFLTGHGDIPMTVQAMKEGATDFLTKPVPEEDLLRAVRQALARNAEERLRLAEVRELQQRAASLTLRESEVMALVVKGWLNKQIADELGAAEKTIKVHRGRVMEKMKVTSLAELVVMARKLRTLPRPSQPQTNSMVVGQTSPRAI